MVVPSGANVRSTSVHFFKRALSQFQPHFVGGAESHRFVKRPAIVAGMECYGAESVGTAPVHYGLHEASGEALSPEVRLGIDILEPSAPRRGIAVRAWPWQDGVSHARHV